MSVTAPSISPAAAPSDAIPDVPIYRLSVEQYHAMARAGILGADARVELLEGWLVPRMTQNPPHVLVAGLIHDALVGLVPAGWHVRSGNPVTTADSEPEPDLAVIAARGVTTESDTPDPGDTALAIEVADTSLRQDRGAKKRIYARAGIAVYWIVNLKARQIEVYADPASAARPPDYGQRHNYGVSDTFPMLLDGVEVGHLPVRDLLP